MNPKNDLESPFFVRPEGFSKTDHELFENVKYNAEFIKLLR